MTTPKVNTIKRGGARLYVNPETAEKVPGVTSIIGMLPKDFLRYWAAKEVATTAVDQAPTVLQMLLNGQREAAIDFLKKAPDRNTRQAADVGTAAHDVFETLAGGGAVGRLHPDVEPFRAHFEDFLEKLQPEIVFREETVWSDTHGYAGSFDGYGVIDGRRLWLDWKTTRSGVHSEVGLQLAAYRYADHILRPDGTRTPMPKADGGAVLHVRPEGWTLVPVQCDEEIFETFLHLRRIFDFDKGLRQTLVGQPVASGSGLDASGAPAKTGPKRTVARARRTA